MTPILGFCVATDNALHLVTNAFAPEPHCASVRVNSIEPRDGTRRGAHLA